MTFRKTPNASDIPVNIVGGSDFGRYDKISTAKTYNMFISTGGADNDAWLVNFPGYKRALDLLDPSLRGQGRGIFNSIRGKILIVVVNSAVYSISMNLIPSFIGFLETNTGEVTMAENLNSQICIVDGKNAYIYNYTQPPALTIQSVASTLIPNYVCFHDTYFLFGNADTSSSNGAQWFAYSYSSATTITLAGTFALQTKPDYAIAVARLPGQGSNVIVFGTTVCEIFTHVGGLINYRRNNTISVDYGCASVSTIAVSDQYVAWLAINENNAPVIMVYSGQGYVPISTDGIDYLMGTIQYPEQSTGVFHRQVGHLFYQLTFYNPVDNLTLMYDFDTKKFFHLTDQNLNYHPARDYAYFSNRSYFISLNTPALYLTSDDITVYDENIGEIPENPDFVYDIPRIRICDSIKRADSGRFIANSFVMTIEQGQDQNVSGVSLLNNVQNIVAEDSTDELSDIVYTESNVAMVSEVSGAGIGQGELPPPYRPKVDLSISNDGGITWSSYVGRDLNPVGVRRNQLTWERLGQSNYLTIKARFWGTSSVVVNNAVLQIY